MTVTELREKLQHLEEHGKGNDVVRVKVEGVTLGWTKAVDIANVFPGFDWDNGRTLLYTSEPVWLLNGGGDD